MENLNSTTEKVLKTIKSQKYSNGKITFYPPVLGVFTKIEKIENVFIIDFEKTGNTEKLVPYSFMLGGFGFKNSITDEEFCLRVINKDSVEYYCLDGSVITVEESLFTKIKNWFSSCFY